MFFYVTLAVLALFLAYRFVITPMLVKLNGLEDQIAQLKEDIDADRVYLWKENSINADYDKITGYLRPPQADADILGNLLKTVSDLASNRSLPINNNKPAIEDKNNIKYYVVRLESEGKMDPLVNFLYDLTNQKNLIYIEKIELIPIRATTTGKEDTLRATIVIYETVIQ